MSPADAQPQVEVRDTDAILGVRPRLAFAPSTIDECAEVMAMAAREQLALGFIGGGTALELGGAPLAVDAVVRTERLARIIEYAAADMVIVVEAGVTLGALQAEVARHGQRLAVDAPWPARATVGGLIATGGFGPLRMRYGTIRDLIIGVTLVRADGEVAHGGGKVVKNVAGFDLPKVACGSLGTLGLVAAAAFRLHPLPEVTRTVVVPEVTANDVVALIAAARAAQLEPASAVALRAGDRFELGVRFEGFGLGVEHQVARFVEIATARPGAEAPRPVVDLARSDVFWQRHDAIRAVAPLRVRVAALPTELPGVAQRLAGLGDFAWYASLGVGFAGGPVPDAGEAAVALTTARAALIAGGGSLVVEAAPAALRAQLDPWGPPPPAFAIMQRLKQRFDPDRRLNPGRFVGGL
jgi:glycolate oxidase FAD binding subunit